MIYVFFVEVPEFGSMTCSQAANSEVQARRVVIHDLNAFGNTAKRIILTAVLECPEGLTIQDEDLMEIEDD